MKTLKFITLFLLCQFFFVITCIPYIVGFDVAGSLIEKWFMVGPIGLCATAYFLGLSENF